MPSLMYQNMVNLFVGFSHQQISNTLMIFLLCGNVVLLTVRFLYVSKLTTLSPLALLIWCKLTLPVHGFKMSPLPTLALKSEQNFRMGFREFIEGTFKFFIGVLHVINVILCWGINVQNNDMTPATS
jgi:hypothetical protein